MVVLQKLCQCTVTFNNFKSGLFGLLSFPEVMPGMCVCYHCRTEKRISMEMRIHLQFQLHKKMRSMLNSKHGVFKL